MAVIQISATDNYTRFNHITDIETVVEVSAVGNSDWYASPDGIKITQLELVPTGSAKVQATIDSTGAAADSVSGVDWPSGVVTERTQDSINGNALVRVVVASGTATLIIKSVK